MPNTILKAIIEAAASAYLGHLGASAAAEDRRRHREAIIKAIDDLRNFMTDQSLAEIKGELEGLEFTFRAYRAVPGDPHEQERLLRIIDGAASLVGRIHGLFFDDLEHRPEDAVAALTAYVSTLFLRGQAQNERLTTFGADESADTEQMFVDGGNKLDALLEALHEQARRRFSRVHSRPTVDDDRIDDILYRFDDNEVICGHASTVGGSDQFDRVFEKCERKREAAIVKLRDESGGDLVATAAASFAEALEALRT